MKNYLQKVQKNLLEFSFRLSLIICLKCMYELFMWKRYPLSLLLAKVRSNLTFFCNLSVNAWVFTIFSHHQRSRSLQSFLSHLHFFLECAQWLSTIGFMWRKRSNFCYLPHTAPCVHQMGCLIECRPRISAFIFWVEVVFYLK